jgi:light-regulated signal transduction histidine kinase (bacteriophytochrome)
MTESPDATAGKGQEIDLSNCDHEPIHVPGAIQPHGVLLALEEPELRILQLSANAENLIGMGVTDLLGHPISILLGRAQSAALRETLTATDLRPANPIKLKIAHNEKLFNGIAHRHQGVLFLELEPTASPVESPLWGYQSVQKALGSLQKAARLDDLWQKVVNEVRGLLGYDRVMIYRFDRAGNGEVIAEEAKEGLETFLGLHYPSSDIPQQARLLYSLNGIRHIPDVHYQPADLIPLIFPVTRDLTDLSYSTLRSVSPIHVEYLQNMGVESSLSISIMEGTRLWGLIACHNYSPKFVPYELRVACELLGQVVSLRMAALESEAQTQFKSETNLLQAKFLEALAGTKDLRDALLTGIPTLLNYLPGGGCAICDGDAIYSLGVTPSTEQIANLVRRLKRIASPVFATDDLHATFAEAGQYKESGSGLLSVAISKEKGVYLMWFRPEQEQTVHWGGNPNAVAYEDEKKQLHPRKSFALWKEVVSHKSLPWTAMEIQAATELRSTLTALLLHRS